MEVGENGSVHAVADELSSPPSSLSDLSPPRDIHLANPQSRDRLTFGVSASPQPPKNSNASATSASSTSNDQKPKPRNRAGPVILPDGSLRERKKPGPKPKPKDPNAPEKQKRKRQKVADAPTSAPQHTEHQFQQTLHPQHAASRQSKITDLVNAAPPSAPHAASEVYQANPSSTMHIPQLGSTPSTPRPASSGQNFDPIRGEISSRLPNPSQSPTHTTHNSLGSRLVPSTSVASVPISPVPPMAKPSHPSFAAPSSTTMPQRSSIVVPSSILSSNVNDMSVDPGNKIMKVESSSGGPPSNAPTPPPQKRAKEQPPPLPTGSGLLAGTPFGGLTPAQTTGSTGTDIFLTFPLKGQNNVTINFAREVERKYGFAALHPRLAARRERQRQLAAASNALEKAAGLGSGDEMSLDVSEPESGNEGNGQGDDGSNAPGDGKKRRKRKAEDYDREDEFVDDAELAWEESALMAKDGFFVYSGPLMTESEKSLIIDRADGTSKRGRGRGGRGGATRGDGTGRGRGGGVGSRGGRGGTTVRKPRVTKADRAAMEQEKVERENMAAQLAIKPQAPAPAQTQLASQYQSAAVAS